MKRIVVAVLAFCLFSGTAWAAKTTYVITNGRFNYVKMREVGAKEAQALGMTHPATIDEGGLRAALGSVNLSRSYVVKKEVDTQQVFDSTAIDYLAPALVRAFSQAASNEKIVFSYLSKNPFFILRNDRLNICDAWVSGDELHIHFQKLYAKMTGDTDKRGNDSKLISQARGLRVQLDLGPGQKLGVEDTDEIVLNLDYNYVKAPEPEKPKPVGVTMTGKKAKPGEQPGAAAPTAEQVGPAAAAEAAAAPAPAAPAAAKPEGKSMRKGDAKAAKGATPADLPPAAAAEVQSVQKSAKDRLEQLNQLKKDGLIDKADYDAKKKEILQGL